eukprot:Skav220799  [mRNA]  locus=scaffold150:363000:364694:+ [translate_table: standard]
MWVLSVENVLQMTGTFQPHQVLKAKGLLAEWRDDMFTIFISHKWLGRQHPDPRADQFQVLQGFLRNLMAGKVCVRTDLGTQKLGPVRALTESEGSKFKDAYIWFDYFCVPQFQHREMEEVKGLKDLQLQYIYSIPYFVDVSQVFLALVPKVIHYDSLSCSDYHTWLDSGWCRTEFWCKILSARSTIPIIVVTSHDVAEATLPFWFRYPVHTGAFTFESDRAACSQVIQTAYAKHLSFLRQAKNKTTYRLHLALFEDLTGVERQCRTMESFLSDFGFSWPLQKNKGLGPAACAALSGDHELLHSLVAAKASVHMRAPGMVETMQIPHMTPLHLACWFKSHDVQILQTLLELRAEVRSSSALVSAPLTYCRTVDAMQLLVRHGANPNDRDTWHYSPIHIMAYLGVPSGVLARLLELRSDVNEGGGRYLSPLHLIGFSGGSSNDLRSAQLLLASRADINQVCQPKGMLRAVEILSRVYCRCHRREPSAIAKCCANFTTTPLGCCSLIDNEQLLIFLLRAWADPEIRNNRGLRPIDFAGSDNIRRILQCPTEEIYLLEYQSEQISEFL